MCLAVPMELMRIDSPHCGMARMDGVERAVNLSLMATPRVGDFLIVHAGFAIEQLNREEAEARLALFEEIIERHNARQSAGGEPCAT